jgi:ATP-binding cassette subfamily F protein uup
VTITLGLDGSGKIDIVAGGYDDWEKRRRPKSVSKAAPPRPAQAAPRPKTATAKLTYNDQRDLDRLPGEIERIEGEIAKAEDALHDPDLYSSDPDRFHALTAKVAELRAEKEAAEERWLEVAAMAEELQRQAS